MNEKKSDPKRYWEAKIKDWDANRHGGNERHENKRNALPLLYRLTTNPQKAHAFRQYVALEHLSTHIKGKRVVEFGCGAGRLSQKIIEIGAASYQGYDIAENAIIIARSKNHHQDLIKFERRDIHELSTLNADFVFSLGLLPWLKDEEINHVFSITRGIDFFHTINVRKYNLRHLLKFIYQHTVGSSQYRVFLRTPKEINDISKKYGWSDLYVFRHHDLFDLACISSLPFSEKIGAHEKSMEFYTSV